MAHVCIQIQIHLLVPVVVEKDSPERIAKQSYIIIHVQVIPVKHVVTVLCQQQIKPIHASVESILLVNIANEIIRVYHHRV